MNCIFSMQKSISKLIFAGYTGSKNQIQTTLKIQFVELDFSKLIFQKSSTDQQGVTDIESSQILKLTYIDQKEYIIRFIYDKCHTFKVRST